MNIREMLWLCRDMMDDFGLNVCFSEKESVVTCRITNKNNRTLAKGTGDGQRCFEVALQAALDRLAAKYRP